MGYSTSVSKDFKTSIIASCFKKNKKKKEENMFGYFTAFKTSLGSPILGSMVYGYCICSMIFLLFIL